MKRLKAKRRPLAVALAVLFAGAFAACERKVEPAPINVVLVTIDTLRADRCSVYGHKRQTTPFLEELASRATVFENAYATSSWTAPSMASLFTSLPPRSHGVVNGFVDDGRVVNQESLSDEFVTLPEALSSLGYRTFGVSTNGHLTAKTGFGQGFDTLAELDWEDAAAVNKRTLQLRDQLEAADRYFLWVHYLDPHSPYDARQPWYKGYATALKDNAAATAMPGLGTFFELLLKYESEINYVDDNIRRLFAALDLERDSLVIITSDHGEAFYEHGKLAHGQSLYEEEIRVPLIVRLPNQDEPRRVHTAASLVDLYPTILDVLGIESPTEAGGSSLLAAARGEVVSDRAVVTELNRRGESHSTIAWQGWKLYSSSAPDPFVKLFDLNRDAGEKEDRASAEPDRLGEMQRRWGRWESMWPRFTAPSRRAPLGEKDRERLRALGYLE